MELFAFVSTEFHVKKDCLTSHSCMRFGALSTPSDARTREKCKCLEGKNETTWQLYSVLTPISSALYFSPRSFSKFQLSMSSLSNCRINKSPKLHIKKKARHDCAQLLVTNFSPSSMCRRRQFGIGKKHFKSKQLNSWCTIDALESVELK